MTGSRYFLSMVCCVGGLGVPFAAYGHASSSPAIESQSGKDVDGILDSIVKCGDVAESGMRLACFDAEISKLKSVKKVGKPLFSEQKSATRPRFTEISSRAVSVSQLGTGTWLVVLADHSVWRTDDIVRFEPKVGDSVNVKRAAFGSFMATIGNQHAVRVRRLT